MPAEISTSICWRKISKSLTLIAPSQGQLVVGSHEGDAIFSCWKMYAKLGSLSTDGPVRLGHEPLRCGTLHPKDRGRRSRLGAPLGAAAAARLLRTCARGGGRNVPPIHGVCRNGTQPARYCHP